jgi:hypothetical protein
MLAKEKKRAVWSLGAGVVLAVVAFGGFYLEGLSMDRQAVRLEASPRSSATPADKDFVPDSDLPKGYTVVPLRGGHLVEVSGADQLRMKANDERAEGTSVALGAVALFALPFIWYFVLDRIREISAAISGRDR